MVSFREFVSMGRPIWRGFTSPIKAVIFRIFGTPDMHTRLRNSYVIAAVQKLLLPPQSRVIDVGSGRMPTSFWLACHHPDFQITGIELDPALSVPAKRAIARGGWTNMRIVEDTIEKLNEQGTINLIYAIDVMEHIVDDIGLFQKFHEALKPGGYLVVHVPRRRQEQWRWMSAFKEHEVDSHVRNEYTADELRDRIEGAGFRVIELRETVGKLGEVAFELNQLFWRHHNLRFFMALLTYPITIPLGYADVRRDPHKGNSLLMVAMRD